LYQWLFTVAIGVGVALTAYAVQTLIALLIFARNNRMQLFYDTGYETNTIFLFFVGYNALLVVVAGVLMVIAGRSAAEDGVAEVKAYLNGTHIHGCFHIRAIICKFFGTILAAAAALACGPEGSMIHIGAGIAYAVTCVDSLSAILPTLETAENSSRQAQAPALRLLLARRLEGSYLRSKRLRRTGRRS
jgi:H+/Cl- antiporter ClcA